MKGYSQAVGNGDHAGTLPKLNGDGLLDGQWSYDDVWASEAQPAHAADSGLVGLHSMLAALGRTVRLWAAATVAGLLIGLAVFVGFPPPHQASASLFITHGPYSYAPTAITDDEVVAQSQTVAALAMHRLGLRGNVSSFDASYTVTPLSDRVLQITATARTASAAVKAANAVAAAYLAFRARQLQAVQALELQSLAHQIGQLTNQINARSALIRSLSSRHASAAGGNSLTALRAEQADATTELTTLRAAASATRASTATTAAVGGSQILDTASATAQSRLKSLLIYAGTGALAALALSMALIVLGAVISDRPRRRDEIARLLGAPVKLSVGPARRARAVALPADAAGSLAWPQHDGRAQPRRREIAPESTAWARPVATHLRNCVPASTGGAATLVVIAAGGTRAAALSVVAAAVDCTRDGSGVVVADLCPDAPAAALLRVRSAGVQSVTVDGAPLTVVVPGQDDVIPIGPRRPAGFRGATRDRDSAFSRELSAVTAAADVILVLATLDPAVGGDHLATWADDAVVIITAGRSSATKIQAVGEMVRVAGVRLLSGVLVGADRADESLGLAPALDELRPAGM